MIDKNSCIAVYNTHSEAENAIKDLTKAGFDIKKLSVVGRGYHTEDDVVGFYNVGDRVKFWGADGAFWGGIMGLLLGAGFFWIPAFGPLVVAGPLASSLIGGLEGAALVGGLTAFGAALYSIGVPRDSVLKYETALKADRFLLIVHGTRAEVERAAEILRTNDKAEVNTHIAA